MFRAIPFEPETHYPLACRWWKAHGWKEPPHILELSPNGIVVEYKDQPVAMTWVYRSDGIAAWVNWIVTERMLETEVKDYAIKHLIDACEILVRGLGYKQLWTTQRIGKLIKRFESRGFRKADVRMTNLVKELY